jgi:hypothetical protein
LKWIWFGTALPNGKPKRRKAAKRHTGYDETPDVAHAARAAGREQASARAKTNRG